MSELTDIPNSSDEICDIDSPTQVLMANIMSRKVIAINTIITAIKIQLLTNITLFLVKFMLKYLPNHGISGIQCQTKREI